MRKRRAVKRDVLPDPIYNSKIVTKLINQIMQDGKKGTAERILNEAFALVKEKTNLWSEYRKTKNKGILSQINDIEKFLFVNDEITEGNRTLQTKTIDFGYALTIHKSQGSTFTHVLMDDVDVQKADMTPTSTEEIDLDGVSNTVIPAP